MTTTAVPAQVKHAFCPAPLQLYVSAPSTPDAASIHLPNEMTLARQILHNLEHQHHWSALCIHTHSPLTRDPLPRPLVSGLPPQRLYVQPDEQVELLKKADRDRKAQAAAGTAALDVKPDPEREWILPTRLKEQWTLRRLAGVFDAISLLPPPAQEPATDSDAPASPWRTTKRVVLATVDTDSTVVYYIVHDGVVKPRQN
ncbi:hypothetical protein ACJQWK_02167 [Exserohilum turcicum]|uniref:tRNA-splicing endonuclease subunit Sen15 domain-containing protein n=1 Tax=Exserohilum turcicum (strain 28A) TaxID=671987 RepID=R0KKF6_EXST2|nr:uncharacterized protein SETTUDRAFT_107438 [Exserohilum turcica Et28A]EOA88467.1 hypothetical protein SETTUDRAFT_107438 [Exserohilum turcica Et28A]